MKIWKDMQQIVTRYENIYQRNSQNHLNSRLYLINWNLCPELLHIFQNINLRMFLNLGILSWSKYFRNKNRRNDLWRLNWHHFVFTSFSQKFGPRNLNYQISYFRKIKWTDWEMLKKDRLNIWTWKKKNDFMTIFTRIFKVVLGA